MKPSVRIGRKWTLILKGSRLFAFLPFLFLLTLKSAGQCIPIDMAFGYTPPDECINRAPVLRLNYIPMGTIPSEDGIYPGTKYYIDWGDGTEVTWFSTDAERVPPLSIRAHQYTGPANCIYEMKSTVTSPCNPAYVKNFGTRVVIHGRDISADGDGNLQIAENGTGITEIIRVCQGSAHLITLRDASIWNCQDPVWPDGLPAPRNDSPRAIQWIYGEDNAGIVWNTIGTTVNPGAPAPVIIGGSNQATTSNGYTGTAITGLTSTGQLSSSILIPSSCREGEFFDVYLLGWNKCNPYPGNAPVFTHIRILVVNAPGVPLAADKHVCLGGDLTLTAADGTPAGDQLTWYANADKTGILGTGNTYTPVLSSPGIYRYYVASGQTSGNLCSGPVKEVTLTIHAIPEKPGINVSGPLSFCFDGTTAVTLTANPANPADVSSYRWYRDGSPFNTNLSNSFDQISHSGSYSVMIFGSAPSNCPSPVSDPVNVSITGFATTTNPSNSTICQGSNTTFTITPGGPTATIQWQRRTPAGTWTDITGAAVPDDGCTYSDYTSASLGIANAAAVMNGYQYRARLTTAAGGCVTYSNAAILTVNPRASITQQPVAATICAGANASFSVTANVAAPSVITEYQWQRRPASGSYTDISATTDGGIYTNFNTAILNISNAPFLIDRYTYQCRITTTGGCTIVSTSRMITVNRYANITLHPPDRTVCETYNTVFSVSDDNAAPVTGRQWQVSTDGGSTWNNLSNGGGYAGVTSMNLSISNVPLGYNGYKYRCILTTAGMCPVTSNAGTLTVYPLPGPGITGAAVSDPSVCAGQTATITLSNSVAGVSYQLQLNSDGTNIGEPVTGTGAGISFSVAPSQTTTYKIRAIMISTGCDRDITDRSVVTVNPLPVPVISGNQNVCAGSTGVIYSTPDAGGRTFTWEISGGSITAGQGTNSVTVSWGSPGTGWLTVRERITATGCESTTSNYLVTIMPGAPAEQPELVSANSNICRGGVMDIDVTDVAGAVEYIWDYSWVAGSNNAVTSGSINSIDLSGLAPGSYSISAAGRNGCGTGNFMDPAHSFTINDIPDLSPLAGTVCSDVASGLFLSVSNPDPLYCTGITFNISHIISGGLSSSAGSPSTGNGFLSGEISDDAWTNIAGSDVNVVYRIIPVSNKGCAGAEENAVLTIKSEPAGVNASLQLCSGSQLNYDLQVNNVNSGGNGQLSSFTWRALDNPDVTGETITTQTTGTITDVLRNVSGMSRVVQYTVIPIGSDMCTGKSFTVSVRVDPEPDLNAVSAEICSGAVTGIVLSDIQGIPGSFEITEINPDAGLVAGSSNAAPAPGLLSDAILNDTWINLTSAALNVVYKIRPVSAEGCKGVVEQIKVKVNPKPVLMDSDRTICSNSPVGVILTGIAGLSNSFNIISVNAEAGLSAGPENSIPGNGKPSEYISSDTWKNTTSLPLSVTYEVVPVINGICSGDPDNIVITVHPPVIAGAISGSASVCYNTDADVINGEAPASGGGGTLAYSWYRTENLAAVPGDGSWTLIEESSGEDYDPGILKEPVMFVRRAQDVSCSDGAYSNTVTITIKPLPVTPAIRGDDKMCDNAVDRIYQVTNHPGSTYTWTVPSAILEETFNAGLYFIVVNAKSGIPGSGQIQVTEKDNSTGCSGIPVKFDVTVSPVLPGGEISGPAAVCQGDAGIPYSVPEVPGSVYSWIVPAGASISNDPKSHEILVSFSQAVTGTVSVAETTPGGCTTIHSPKMVVVNQLPLVYNLTAPAVYCDGENGVTATLSGSQDGVIYQLYREGTAVGPPKPGTGQAITWSGITAGTYSVKASATATSCLREMNRTAVISIRTLPEVALDPVSREVCENAVSVTFTARGAGIIDSLRWQVYSGIEWKNLADNDMYSGTGTPQLMVRNIPASLDGNRYRMSIKGVCAAVNTNEAILTVNSNPVVKFAADTINVCSGIPVALNGNPAGGSAIWESHLWTGDTGPLSDRFVQSPLFTSISGGSYVMNYKVKDSKGCYGEKGVTVVVDNPDAEFVQSIMTGCEPLEVSFSKDLAGISKFWWDFGDGSPVDSVNANPVHKYYKTTAVSTEYRNPKLTVQSAAGCKSTKMSIVTLYPQADAAFTPDRPVICSGEEVTFTASRGATKYFWDFGDGESAYSPVESVSHTYTNAGSVAEEHRVKLITTSFYGCPGEKSIIIKVLPAPEPEFSATPSVQPFNVSGNTVSFKNETGSGSLSYLWSFGDGKTSTITDPVHTYGLTGIFKVHLVASNEACSDSVVHEVVILPFAPVAGFDSIGPGCEPLDVRFTNTSTHTEIPGTAYLWNFGDGTQSTAKEPMHTFFHSGTYHVELKITGPGGTSYKSRDVKVYPSPRANFDVAPTVVFLNDEKVRMFNLSTNADTYLWEFGDGDTSTLREPFHKYMTPGVYDITLHAYSNKGCSNTFVLTPGVTVKSPGEIRFATVFRPNKDGPIERTDLPTGGDAIDQFFFPPMREEVTGYKLQIFNRWGVLIFEARDINIPWNGYYKGSLCPQGVYIWYVEGKYANGMPFKKVGDITLLH